MSFCLSAILDALASLGSMLEGQSVTEWVMFMRFRQLMPVIASDRLSSAIGSQGSAHPLGFFQVSIAIYPTSKKMKMAKSFGV